MNKKKTWLSTKLLVVAMLCLLGGQAHATISDLDTKTVTSLGNGATVNYTIGFTFTDNTQVLVYREEQSSTPYVRTLIAQGAGASKFTITGGNPGTTVHMGTAPTSSQRLVIVRSIPFTQTVDYVETDAFPAEDHEEAMDRAVMMIQGLNADISNKVGFSAESTATVPTFPEPLANRFIGYNAGATGLTWFPSSAITLASGDVLKYNGTTWTTYALDAALTSLTSGLSDLLGSTGLIKVSGGAFSAATLVNADVSSSAAIARSKLADGTASHVVINSGAGVMTSEAQLATSRGGTGQDLSASTGLVKVSAGTGSAATLVDADVSASAAISRAKIAAGSLNHVIVNDGSTGALTSVAPGTSGNVLRSNGTAWASAAPTSGTAQTSWHGFHDTDCLWTRTNTALGVLADDASCTLTQLNNNGFGTVNSVGSVSPGLSFTPTQAGYYDICAYVDNYIQAGTTQEATLQLSGVAGAEVVIAWMTSIDNSASGARVTPLCGMYHALGTSVVTLKITTRSNSGEVRIGSPNDGKPIWWVMKSNF